MRYIVAAADLMMAAVALAWGVTTEYRQTRQDGPVAIVATLPFGVAAALLATIGTLLLMGRDLRWWIYLVEFLGLAIAFCQMIMLASARSAP